jgi:hypothetical protein
MRFLASTILLLVAASSAFAQIDAFSLRSKYGAPLDRETFTVRPSVEMIVDYGPNKNVCRIQLPSGMRIVGTVPPGAITKQQIDEILGEVVPPAIRGKEINRGVTAMGAAMFSITDYEHVSIGEGQNAITVTFKDAACPK